MTPEALLGVMAGVMVLAAGGAGAVSAWKRRSQVDDADAGRLAQALKEAEADRAAALTAWAAHSSALATVARLEAEAEHYRGEAARLAHELDKLRRLTVRLYPAAQPYLASTDFAPPALEPEERELPR